MNRRPFGFIFLMVVVVGLICLSLYVISLPKATEYTSQVKQTEAAIATIYAEETRIAMEAVQSTSTSLALAATQTQQAVPTSTFTPTPIPVSSTCQGTIKGTPLLYSAPYQAAQIIATLQSGSPITVAGKIDDGWYQISGSSNTGWILKKDVEIVGNCNPTLYSLAYAIGLVSSGDVFEDNFRNLADTWIDKLEPPVKLSFTADSFGDFQMHIPLKTQIDATGKRVPYPAEITTDKLGAVSHFRFITSYARANQSLNAYLGLRFGDKTNFYYEVQILGDCRIRVIQQNGPGITPEERILQPSPEIAKSCSDNKQDYLDIKWDGTELVIYLNDTQDPFRAQIGVVVPTPSQLTIVAYNGTFSLNFVVLDQHQ